jgi:hypothetical protein
MAGVNYKPNQGPFPVVFVAEPPYRASKTQVGLLHVASLAEVPRLGDRVWLPRPGKNGTPELVHPQVLRRQVHYKPAEPNEPAVIDFVEVILA